VLAPVRMRRANEEQDHIAHEATSAPAQLGPQDYIAGAAGFYLCQRNVLGPAVGCA